MNKLTQCSFAVAAALSSMVVLAAAPNTRTATPIKHVIVIIGENVSFDTLFGTYAPPSGQTILNLRSQGIVNGDGTPGPNYAKAVQRLGSNRLGRYTVNPLRLEAYEKLPQPLLTGVFNPQTLQLFGNIPDVRFAGLTANGPFQITDFIDYANPGVAIGDPVHRFCQSCKTARTS